MKKYLVKTQSGSTYRLLGDSWERVGESESSGAIRTLGGSILTEVVPEVGTPLVLHTDNINPLAQARVIITSPVTGVEEIE